MSLQLIIDIALFLIYCCAVTLLIAWTWKFWMLYVNHQWIKKLDWDVIEIKLPREINKNPEATELFLRSIIEGGGLGSWYKENWEGRIPAFASLEIASLEGVIHFYIRIEKRLRPRTEAAIYSQYPTVEINVVDDYMNQIPYDFTHNAKNDNGFWGTEWILAKSIKGRKTPNKDNNKIEEYSYSGDMYPIKTYKDWGLDKNPDEMYKNDPLTYLIEQMATIGKGEYMCHQLIIRDATKWNKMYTITKKDKSEESGKELSDITSIEMDSYKKSYTLKEAGKGEKDEWGNKKVDKDGKELTYVETSIVTKPLNVMEREEDAKRNLELLQRKKNKQQAICVMRTIYVAENRSNLKTRIPIVMGLTRPFNEDGFNTLRPNYIVDPFDFPWQNTGKKLVPWRRENLYYGYIERAGLFSFSNGMGEGWSKSFDIRFFKCPSYIRYLIQDIYNVIFHPFRSTVAVSGFILNIEEIATLFHFPGEVAATPTLPRIDSVKSSGPSNLPI